MRLAQIPLDVMLIDSARSTAPYGSASHPTVLESGRHENPTVETLSKLARALGYELGFQLTAV